MADQDGLYDPTDYNDRLLLGLKGTMSEAELHVLQAPASGLCSTRARRGSVYLAAPIGYVRSLMVGSNWTRTNRRGVVTRVFELFDRLGSVRALWSRRS